MRRVFAVIVILLFLVGCGSDDHMNRALSLREQLLKSNGCTFDAVVTADYGDAIYTFSMNCQTDKNGNLFFAVTDPETIKGINGRIDENSGSLTFDSQVLAFETLADGQITPVSAPWILIHTLRGGYLASCGKDESGLRIRIDDSYEEDALLLDIWLDDSNLPFRGEILWQGRRVVSIDVRNFSYL